ncbi:hypothetical protein EVAR_75740_1 [Eumeta japonica]|uniref:Uncharacterized protein n=1 Tax=Eumeta variegata TaxID=151549 RepID=A0A4C1TCU6_EUMVA|nr:hypothetical protein EVAR_75740_1 [Eumeta japonica]
MNGFVLRLRNRQLTNIRDNTLFVIYYALNHRIRILLKVRVRSCPEDKRINHKSTENGSPVRLHEFSGGLLSIRSLYGN